MYHLNVEFEFDPVKSALNQQKHGISLDEAKALWLVPAVAVQAKTIDEPRWLRIGKLDEKFYSCIFTVRGERIRLISARRSSEQEKDIYEKKIREETAGPREDPRG